MITVESFVAAIGRAYADDGGFNAREVEDLHNQATVLGVAHDLSQRWFFDLLKHIEEGHGQLTPAAHSDLGGTRTVENRQEVLKRIAAIEHSPRMARAQRLFGDICAQGEGYVPIRTPHGAQNLADGARIFLVDEIVEETPAFPVAAIAALKVFQDPGPLTTANLSPSASPICQGYSH